MVEIPNGLAHALLKYIGGVDQITISFIDLFEILLRRRRTKTGADPLKKLQIVQDTLAEVLNSTTELQQLISSEQEELNKMSRNLKKTESEQAEVQKELATSKDLLQKDREQLRKALGLNDNRAKLIGFVSGVIASLVATVIWYLFSNLLWPLVKAQLITYLY